MDDKGRVSASLGHSMKTQFDATFHSCNKSEIVRHLLQVLLEQHKNDPKIYFDLVNGKLKLSRK